MKNSKNIALLNDFIHYCISHPEERFWQALRNWSGSPYVFVGGQVEFDPKGRFEYEDTFYFEGKDK